MNKVSIGEYNTLVNKYNEVYKENKELKKQLEEYKNPIKYFKYANKNVTEENKQLKEELKCTIGIVEHNRIINEKNREIRQLKIQIFSEKKELCNRLENNWNELKEYLHNVDVVVDYSENYDGHFINYDELIDKMQELEGSDSNGQ